MIVKFILNNKIILEYSNINYISDYEINETIALLAYEKNCKISDIHTKKEV